jgi:hypothetical protein
MRMRWRPALAISRASIGLTTLILLMASSIAGAQSEQKPAPLTRKAKDRALMAVDAAAEKSPAARPAQGKEAIAVPRDLGRANPHGQAGMAHRLRA